MSMSADLGPWSAPVFEPWPKVWDNGSLHKASPSRLKRRLRRASERERIVAAEKDAAKKAAAEKGAAEKVAAEKVAAEKVAAEKVAAEKVAAEKVAAEKVAAEKDAAEKAAAKKDAAEKATAKKDAAEKAVKEAEQASTSSCGRAQMSCWSCDEMFPVDSQGYIPEHQCAQTSPCVKAGPSPPMVLKKPVRMLNGSPVWSQRPK